MNDTNNLTNNNENIVGTPTIQPQIVPVQQQPVLSQSAPITPAQPQPVQAPVQSSIQTTMQEMPTQAVIEPTVQQTNTVQYNSPVLNVETEIKSENITDDSEENKEASQNSEIQFEKKFPWAVLIIIIALIGLALWYYFYWITPTRVFDNAIDDTFSSIDEFVKKFTESSAETTKIRLEGTLDTYDNNEGDNNIDMTSNKSIAKDVQYIDELKINLDIQAALKNLDFAVKFWTDNSNAIKEKMTYSQDFNIAFDYVDNDLYLRIGDDGKAIKYSNNDGSGKYNISFERVNSALNVLEKIKNEVVDIVQEDQLERKITYKRINNQTALAIGVKTELDNEEISYIYNTGFADLKKDNEFVKELATMLAVSEDEASKVIDELLDRKVITQNIVVNLYMNLANTKLIGVDIRVGDYYFEMSALNGYHYIDIKKYNGDNEEIDIEITYDNETGNINGVWILNSSGLENLSDIIPNYTKLRIDFNYKPTNETGNYSNTMDLKFSMTDDKSETPDIKPFAILNFKLKNETDVPVEILDTSNVVPAYTISKDSLESLSKMIEKIGFEGLFVYGKLMLNELPESQIKSQTGENSKYFERIKEHIKSEMERIYAESLSEAVKNGANTQTEQTIKNNTDSTTTQNDKTSVNTK